MRDQFLTINQVAAMLGVNRSTLYRRELAGDFPKRTRQSRRCVGWWKSEIDRWIASRPKGMCG